MKKTVLGQSPLTAGFVRGILQPDEVLMAGTCRWRLFCITMDERKINFIKKLLGSDPTEAFRFVAADEGLDLGIVDHAESIFRKVRRIDLVKMHPAAKGFIIILDQRLSLWFFKRGDSFSYDGFEIGPYGRGRLDPEESER